jgi:hypothetical protein
MPEQRLWSTGLIRIYSSRNNVRFGDLGRGKHTGTLLVSQKQLSNPRACCYKNAPIYPSGAFKYKMFRIHFIARKHIFYGKCLPDNRLPDGKEGWLLSSRGSSAISGPRQLREQLIPPN